MTAIHDAARQGYSNEAKSYESGRPEYPGELQSWLSDALAIGAGTTVLDLGAGTGKFSQRLVRTGAAVVAVEPVAAMRERLAAKLPTVTALPGTAERMPVETGSADVVICAQAFHWFATDAALQEIHRVLRPGGQLGLVWNVRDESVDWVAAITEIITPYEGDAPRFYKGDWRRPFGEASFGRRGFSPLQSNVFVHHHLGGPELVIIDRFLSVSFIAALPDAEKARVKAQLQTLIDTHPALRGRDSVAFPYRTEAYRCARLDI
ncbi:class I SAM-dependent methyltransferase [Chitinimonas lacunae]|uniref:Methyltransferase domain-containing protein n=1 Tax=Chitinimonas lacunae TaxID=1963018 RepID=A0ABV8MPB3_9NEIS